jgi:hypothetical protein
LTPQPQKVNGARRHVERGERRQVERQLYVKCRSPRAKRRRPEHEKRTVLRAVELELRAQLTESAPLLRSHRDPFDAAAAREQSDRERDQGQTDPNGPPILATEKLAPQRRADGELSAATIYGFHDCAR